MKIGFIGMGIMGSRMAANLQKQGYELVVYNRSPEKTAPLVEKGALKAKNPAAVAEQVDILFTMLAHPEAVRKTALGENGFLDALKSKIWVDCSTVDPTFSRQMAAAANSRGVKFLDAPVAGSKGLVEKAEVMFVVGGAKVDLQVCQPLLESMGKKVVHVGEAGMGTSLKLVLNLLLGASMAVFAEGMVLGEALGISQEMLLRVLIGAPVTAPFIALKKDKLERGEYETEFPLKWMQKDLHLVANAGYRTGIPLPLANLTKEVYQQAIAQGLGEQDFAAVYQSLKDISTR